MSANHQFYYQVRMAENHVMKFVYQGRTHPENKGIRTFPQHTFGVSKESPDHFQQHHTLINHGYHYQHEQAPRFEYHSQKKSHALAHEHPHEPHHENLHHTLTQNPHRFHLKKGRLTEFWDKNSWMKTVYLMNGHERSERSRSFNNRDRDGKIKNLKERIQYESELIKKPVVNQSYYNTLQELMSERVRIRTRRNKEAQSQLPLTQRTLSEIKVGELQGENIKTKMTKTAKEWYPTLKDRRMSREMSFKEEKVLREEHEFDIGTDSLEEWQRKTCNSKWCYNAPKDDPFDNIETQQIL